MARFSFEIFYFRDAVLAGIFGVGSNLRRYWFGSPQFFFLHLFLFFLHRHHIRYILSLLTPFPYPILRLLDISFGDLMRPKQIYLFRYGFRRFRSSIISPYPDLLTLNRGLFANHPGRQLIRRQVLRWLGLGVHPLNLSWRHLHTVTHFIFARFVLFVLVLIVIVFWVFFVFFGGWFLFVTNLLLLCTHFTDTAQADQNQKQDGGRKQGPCHKSWVGEAQVRLLIKRVLRPFRPHPKLPSSHLFPLLPLLSHKHYYSTPSTTHLIPPTLLPWVPAPSVSPTCSLIKVEFASIYWFEMYYYLCFTLELSFVSFDSPPARFIKLRISGFYHWICDLYGKFCRINSDISRLIWAVLLFHTRPVSHVQGFGKFVIRVCARVDWIWLAFLMLRPIRTTIAICEIGFFRLFDRFVAMVAEKVVLFLVTTRNSAHLLG